MKRKLIAIVTVASVTVGIYLASTTDAPSGAASMRVATCGVRVSDECLKQYPALKRYETLRFPVLRDTSDGGLSFILPRALGAEGAIVRGCVEVVDWESCDIDTCAMHPAVCGAWDARQPVTRVRAASKYVIPDCRKPDGGWDDHHAPVDCVELDGGWRGCNVALRSQRVGTQCLDAPTGVVYAGERVEDSL